MNKNLIDWLSIRGIVLDESFVDALRRLSEEYQTANSIRHLGEVYELIGVSKQVISWWKINPYGIQTKKF